jgi:uncharacterized protein YsxB (DUF464 family)
MIHINANRKDGKIVYLSVEGHANFDEEGKDIVCSAVSAISVGGLNALENPDKFNIKVEKGFVEVSQKSVASEHDYQVLETMLIQLKSVEETNSKYVRVVEKGN